MVHVFLSDLVASIAPPVKRLRRFVKVPLVAGESRSLRFRLTRDDLAFVGRDGKPVVEGGTCVVTVGGLQQEITRQ